MKKEMLKSLKRRFNGIEENKYVVIATLLDPRFKDKFFSGHEQRENAKLLLKQELEKISEDRCTGLTLEPREEPPSKKQKIWDIFAEIIEESGASISKDDKPEIETYLSEPLIDFSVNCYSWWAMRYPCISSLVRQYLSAPPTSVPSERLFSGASNLYDDRRNRLAPERAEVLLLIKNNFYHYLDYLNK